ncbi:hypothetical protein C8R43DRAFT_955686 [Mycena crocata]|nr:hypothetical protein C8R43DRAFT_955686 [Mycena crocata]
MLLVAKGPEKRVEVTEKLMGGNGNDDDLWQIICQCDGEGSGNAAELRRRSPESIRSGDFSGINLARKIQKNESRAGREEARRNVGVDKIRREGKTVSDWLATCAAERMQDVYDSEVTTGRTWKRGSLFVPCQEVTTGRTRDTASEVSNQASSPFEARNLRQIMLPDHSRIGPDPSPISKFCSQYRGNITRLSSPSRVGRRRRGRRAKGRGGGKGEEIQQAGSSGGRKKKTEMRDIIDQMGFLTLCLFNPTHLHALISIPTNLNDERLCWGIPLCGVPKGTNPGNARLLDLPPRLATHDLIPLLETRHTRPLFATEVISSQSSLVTVNQSKKKSPALGRDCYK